MAEVVLPRVKLTRTMDAPRALVWKVWTDPKHVAQWWGPRGFDCPLCEIDLRPGGKFTAHMKAPDGTIMEGGGQVREVVAPERFVFTTTYVQEGVVLVEGLHTVTFTEKNGKTTIVLDSQLIMMAPGMEAAADGMEEGWSSSLDKMVEHVARVQG